MLTELLGQTIEVVRAAAQLATDARRADITEKEGQKNFVTAADKAISDYLLAELPRLLPGSAVISEEQDPDRPVGDGYTWIVDPIDGTSNFIFQTGMSAVSVGLVHGGEAVLGVVYNLVYDEMFSACHGGGAYLNGRPIHVSDAGRIGDTLIFAETSPYEDRRDNGIFRILQRAFFDCVDIRIQGSAALSICAVACGRGGACIIPLLHSWDVAGALAILQEAGGMATDFCGAPVPFEGTPAAACSNGKLHAQLLTILNS